VSGNNLLQQLVQAQAKLVQAAHHLRLALRAWTMFPSFLLVFLAIRAPRLIDLKARVGL
jgi:hypothetical protein